VRSFSALDVAAIDLGKKAGALGRQQSSVKSTGHKGPVLSKIAREKLFQIETAKQDDRPVKQIDSIDGKRM